MDTELIDNGFDEARKRRRVRISHWMAIVFLWLGIAACATFGLLREFKVVLATLLLITVTTITYFNALLGMKAMLIPLFLGTLNLVTFFPLKFFIGPEISVISLRFEFILLFVTGLHIYYNDKILTSFLKRVFKANNTKEITITNEMLLINRFKVKYDKKRKSELESIINNPKMTDEARKAAKELHKEKLHQ